MNAPALTRAAAPSRVERHSAVADLARLAIPVILIAGAVAATLWIDHGSGVDSATPGASAAPGR